MRCTKPWNTIHRPAHRNPPIPRDGGLRRGRVWRNIKPCRNAPNPPYVPGFVFRAFPRSGSFIACLGSSVASAGRIFPSPACFVAAAGRFFPSSGSFIAAVGRFFPSPASFAATAASFNASRSSSVAASGSYSARWGRKTVSRPRGLVGFGGFVAGVVGGEVAQRVFQLAGQGVVDFKELEDAALVA